MDWTILATAFGGLFFCAVAFSIAIIRKQRGIIFDDLFDGALVFLCLGLTGMCWSATYSML